MADFGSYEEAADQLVAAISKLAEVRRVPKDAPDNNSMFPFVVLQPLSGNYTAINRTNLLGLHNITIELHVKKYELDRAQDKLKSMMDDIPNRCIAALNAGDLPAIHQWQRIEYLSGPLEWSGVDTLGALFTFIDVKVVSEIS